MQQIFKKISICLIILVMELIVVLSIQAEPLPPKKLDWPFNGILGQLDVQAAQRGFKVYKEVCSACHSLKYVSYRNLADIGFSADEIKAIAREYNFQDGPNDQGEIFERSGLPSDQFYSPFPNDKAARAANNGSYPVDLSLIIKAREKGADYVYSLLTGYTAPPEEFKLEHGLYYNPYFSIQKIAMPPPLTDHQVSYSDGTNSSVEQMAKDIVVFLQWAAEPEMTHRKSMGLKVIIFLIIFSTIFYIAKEGVWSNIKDKHKNTNL